MRCGVACCGGIPMTKSEVSTMYVAQIQAGSSVTQFFHPPFKAVTLIYSASTAANATTFLKLSFILIMNATQADCCLIIAISNTEEDPT